MIFLYTLPHNHNRPKVVQNLNCLQGLCSLMLFSHSVMSNSLQPHGQQHARLPCPSPSPGVCSNACPLSRCCHPTISSSFAHFSSSAQSFPASGSLPMSQLFASGSQSIRRRQWHPTPVLLPGKSHGWRSLVGCSPWGR